MKDGGKIRMKTKKAFTLIELLVVIAILAVLAALLFPVLSSAQKRAKRAHCVNNLRQINTAVLMYAHDNADTLPKWRSSTDFFFKERIKGYVGLSGPPKPGDKLFICPSETPDPSDGKSLFSADPGLDYSDYFFNAWLPDQKLTSLRHPSMTALVTEMSGLFPFSFHQPQFKYVWVNNPPNAAPYMHAAYNNALNEMSYVDGHINYIKIYSDGISLSLMYDPPAGYDYQWSGD